VDVLDGERRSELAWNVAERFECALLGPEPVLRLDNPGAEPRTVVVEDARWSDDALRPARLFSFQEFRDLFTDEYLGVDIQLSVGRQTILFTDVVGSTRLYATRGDPGAFMDVKRHFTEIYEEVKNHGGAIVKTIGDAAMAAFVDPVRALRAARAIHAHFPPGRADLALRVRISLNTGPCIAVKLNTNIDYFGNTVNLAAKLQSIAGAGQISFTEDVLEQPGVSEYLEGEQARLERLTLDSPTLARPVPAVRWSTDP
jgi:class 3 adenylate cyclase